MKFKAHTNRSKTKTAKAVFALLLSSFFLFLSVSRAHASFSASNTPGANTNNSSLNRGLVIHYTFDGKDMIPVVVDTSGNNNHGYLVSYTSTTTIAGKISQALSMNGAQNQAVFSPVVGVPASFTWSTWFKTSKANLNTIAMSNLYRYLIITDCGGGINKLYFSVNGAVCTGTNADTGTIAVNDNKWHLATAIAVGNTQYLYLDGVLMPQQGTQTLDQSADRIKIGLNDNGNTYTGIIDDFRVYNRALSSTEIRQLYLLGQTSLQTTQTSNAQGCSTGTLSCGLVGYWTFNNQDINWQTGFALDKSGFANNGQLLSLSTTSSPIIGPLGQALQFDGASSGIDTGSSAITNLTSSFTLSAWIRPSAVVGFNTIIGKRSSVSNWPYVFGLGGANQVFLYANAGSDISVNTAQSLTLNKWTHVVAVRNGTAITFYINGKADSGGTQTLAQGSSDPSAKFCIGMQSFTIGVNCNNNPFIGSIDDVRVYNRPLSASEARQLYLQGQTSMQATQSSSQQGCSTGSLSCGLQVYLTFNNQDMNWTTGKIIDKSGQGNDGIMSGMSTTTSPVQGRVGQALNYTSATTNKYVTITNQLAITSNLTLSAWIKLSDLSHAYGIFEKYDGTNADFELYFSPGQNQIDFYDDSVNSGGSNSLAGSISDKNWHHVVFVRNGSSISFYIDGSLSGSTFTVVGSTSFNNHNIPTYVGSSPFDTNPFQGSLDDARIYNRALSAVEVRQLYLLGR